MSSRIPLLHLLVYALTTLAFSQPNDVGKQIFAAKCAYCHGPEGKGDGVPAALLNPRPRNFTSGMYKFRSTESGSIPTDEDLFKTVKFGLRGAAMPDWGTFIGDDSIRAVIGFVKSLSPRFQSEKPQPVKLGSPIASAASSIAAGKKAYEKLQCGLCHGRDGIGTDAIQTEFRDEAGLELTIPKLNEPWTFRCGASARDIFTRFRTGMDGTPMPSFKGAASDAEMWHLANYVVSLARKPAWQMSEQELKAFFAAQDAEAKANPVKRGKYIVETMCVGCHSQYSPGGVLKEGTQLTGGLTFDLYPYGKATTINLTPDKETGLGNYTDDEIKRALTLGIRKDGTKMLPFPMPWISFSQMSDDDRNGVIAYLRSLPAVSHKTAPWEPKGFFAYMWGKFSVLILKAKVGSTIYPQDLDASTKEAKP
jgi:cytochrome c oxidase cbb3-type subunit 2